MLSCTSSKNQLKWQGTNESLWSFLSSQLALQLKDNGTCAVIKAKGMTFNSSVKTLTLQIQGKENVNQLRPVSRGGHFFPGDLKSFFFYARLASLRERC